MAERKGRCLRVGTELMTADSDENEDKERTDSGLVALTLLLRMQGVAVDAEQIRQRCGADAIGIPEMMCHAREVGLEARSITTDWKHLAGISLPAIAARRDGSFLLLGNIEEDSALIASSSSPRLEVIKRAEFESIWDGRLLLIEQRVGDRDEGQATVKAVKMDSV